MDLVIENFLEVVQSVDWIQILIILVTAVLGFIIARVIGIRIGEQIKKKIDPQAGFVAEKIIFYGFLLLIVAVILNIIDVGFTTLIAAGGLLAVAIGFASQTAVSNLISGIFLIFERPFNVGDVIRVDGNFGAVQSIDLISTKIRMFDNLYWRMPNEKLLRSDIITITKYDIRRMDLAASISYSDDIQVARDTLINVANENHLVMGDPEPVVLVNKMGESGIELTLRCWFFKTDFIKLLTELTHSAKVALEEAGCTIPFPHRTVYLRNEDDWQKAHLIEAGELEENEDLLDPGDTA